MAILSGVVLAGGQSRRLGTDKALLRIDGQTLLATTVERLYLMCDEVIIVTNTPQVHSHPLARSVVDAFPGKGSLGGIYSGLAAAKNTYSLVVACDMPFLNTSLLLYFSALAEYYDVVIPRFQDSLEPLHAIYSKACLPHIKALLDQNILRIIDLFSRVRTRYVEEHEWAIIDPERLSFFNINTPQDLEKARVLWNKLYPPGSGLPIRPLIKTSAQE